MRFVQRYCEHVIFLLSSVRELETYVHCQRICSFESLEVQSQLCSFAAKRLISEMISQSTKATLGNPWYVGAQPEVKRLH